jgi:hypothetical protein
MLVERGTNRGAKTGFASRSIAHALRERAELLEHFTLEEIGRVLHTEPLQRPLGEIPQQLARLGIELVERRRCSRGRGDTPPGIAFR